MKTGVRAGFPVRATMLTSETGMKEVDKTERSYKYFTVRERGPNRPGVYDGERWYRIFNNRSGLSLGTIEWYARWRQFCFFPQRFSETVWSAECLADLQNAIKWAEERKRK